LIETSSNVWPSSHGSSGVEQITQSILVFRGHKVLLDEDLASLYGVMTSALVQAVKRNIGRFPEDFMFQLTAAEWTVLRSQTVIPTSSRGGRRFAPYVFTEQGVAMLSSVLGSERAIAINIEIMRAFVKLRDLLSSNRQSPPSSRPSASSWANRQHTKRPRLLTNSSPSTPLQAH
jgi:ORF6N domain